MVVGLFRRQCRLEWRWGSGFGLVLSQVVVQKIVFGVVCPSCFPCDDQRNNQSLPKSELESGAYEPQNYWKLVIYCQLAERAQITTQLTEFVPAGQNPCCVD